MALEETCSYSKQPRLGVMHYLRRRTQAAQGIQAASQLDLRHFPQVLTFQRIGAALGELVAQALKYDGGLVVHTAEPALVMTDEQLATLWALQGAGVVAVVAEEVVEIEVVHLVDLADHLRTEVVAQQVVDQLAALLRLDPQGTEVVEVAGFRDDALDHLAAVLIDRNRRVAAIAAAEDEAALGIDDDGLSADLGHGGAVITASAATTRVIATTPAATETRRLGDEVGAEQMGNIGVVVEPELVLLSFLMDAGAAPDHLVELDR